MHVLISKLLWVILQFYTIYLSSLYGLESRHGLRILSCPTCLLGGSTRIPARTRRGTRGLPPPVKLESGYMTLLCWCKVLMLKN
jgi:hypothetical protein